MYGYIYITTNKINNKKYIGQHRSSTFDKNYIGSGVLLQKAVEHYGKENFETSILRECFSEDDLNQSEVDLIKEFDAVHSDDFYNIANGGEGHTCSPWNKGLTGLPVTEAQLNNLKKGRHLPASEKQRKQLSARRKNCVVSLETRSLLSKNAKGRIGINNGSINKCVKSEELDDFLTHGWKLGHIVDTTERVKKFRETHANKSDKQKQETKQKLHDAFVGTIWVTNGSVSKQIKQDQLQEFLDKGFVRGRKYK